MKEQLRLITDGMDAGDELTTHLAECKTCDELNKGAKEGTLLSIKACPEGMRLIQTYLEAHVRAARFAYA